MATFLPVMVLPMASRSMPPELDDLERHHVGVHLVVELKGGLVALHLREHALLGRVAPARMRPDLGLGAQALHRAIEDFDHQLGVDDRVADPARRQQVNLRLLDLDHRAAGVGQLVVFLVEGVGEREHAVGQALVVLVLHREGDDLGRHRAPFHRLLGEALRRLPHLGVLQVAAADRPDHRRHHPRFQVVVQDVAAREGRCRRGRPASAAGCRARSPPCASADRRSSSGRRRRRRSGSRRR